MGDAGAVRGYMASLKQSSGFRIEEPALNAIRAEFDAGKSTIEETAKTIANTLKASGYLLDPHTATAVHVAESAKNSAPTIILGTAHPAKFPDAVHAASGITPKLPEWLADLMERREKFTVLPSDLKQVEEHISRLSRAAI